MKAPLNVYRAVWLLTLFWLIGWYIKSAFFFPYLFDISFNYPAVNEFFPPLLRSNPEAALFYLLPVFSASSLFSENVWVHRLSALIMTVSAAVLCLHQNTYNDATFVSSFWAALWLLWFSFSFNRLDRAEEHAIILGHWIVGLMFLGGFVGKLTPEYLSGEVFRRIFTTSNGPNPLSAVLSMLKVTDSSAAFRAISLSVVAIEGILALNILVRTRFMRILSLACLPLLTLFSTWRILSVVSSLAGLLLAVGSLNNNNGKAARS